MSDVYQSEARALLGNPGIPHATPPHLCYVHLRDGLANI